MSTVTSNRMLASLAGILVLAVSPMAAAQGIVVCLRSGTEVAGERLEVKGDAFVLHLGGGRAPVELAAGTVAGINVPCASTVSARSTASVAQPSVGSTAGSDAGFGIHGSNTIGERLMPMLIENFSQVRFGNVPEAKLGAAEEQELRLGSTGRPKASIELHAHGSGTAAKGLASGAAQIGMSSRAANDAEVQAVQSAQRINLRQSGNEHVLALDGLAVVVNPANTVRQLSLDQIAKIYSGEITTWSDVGGSNAPIKAHRRDDKSGTYDTFNALVLAPRKLKPAATVVAHESSERLSDEVLRDPNAIGFIGLPYINRNQVLAIAEPCGLTNTPSTFGIKTEAYPLSRRLYLYSIGVPRHPLGRELLAFTLSDAAQATIKEAGFVDQSVEWQSAAAQRGWMQSISTSPGAFLPQGKELPADGKAALSAIATAANRTTLALRFERGSAELDTRARQDVARFARYLNSPAAQGKRFRVVGFADSDGGWAVNVRLSKDRATRVGDVLREAGVAVQADQLVGLSYQAPVACNDTEDGRRKNRRAEIWIEN